MPFNQDNLAQNPMIDTILAKVEHYNIITPMNRLHLLNTQSHENHFDFRKSKLPTGRAMQRKKNQFCIKNEFKTPQQAFKPRLLKFTVKSNLTETRPGTTYQGRNTART